MIEEEQNSNSVIKVEKASSNELSQPTVVTPPRVDTPIRTEGNQNTEIRNIDPDFTGISSSTRRKMSFKRRKSASDEF